MCCCSVKLLKQSGHSDDDACLAAIPAADLRQSNAGRRASTGAAPGACCRTSGHVQALMQPSPLCSRAPSPFGPVTARPVARRWFFLLVNVQTALQTFYEPARCAALPTLFPTTLAHIVSTLDTFCFSLAALVGGVLAGMAASHWGPGPCFLVDASGFLVAGLCCLPLVSADRGRVSARRASAAGAAGPAAVLQGGQQEKWPQGEQQGEQQLAHNAPAAAWLAAAGSGGDESVPLLQPVAAAGAHGGTEPLAAGPTHTIPGDARQPSRSRHAYPCWLRVPCPPRHAARQRSACRRRLAARLQLLLLPR